jgi:hypothetical protein
VVEHLFEHEQGQFVRLVASRASQDSDSWQVDSPGLVGRKPDQDGACGGPRGDPS